MTQQPLHFGIIVAQFNHFITDKLLEGALETLEHRGIQKDNIEVIRVRGSFELSLAAKKMAKSKKFNALVCLGAVIRGETSHYDLVSREAASGIHSVSLEFEIPIGFGVVTAENMDQAMDRAGGKMGNKGSEAAQAALDMLRI